MGRIQKMMRENKAVDDNGRETILLPVIPPKFASTPNCPIPKCHSCELARQKRRSPQVKKSTAIPKKDAVLSRDRYEAGDFVSADQFVVNTPGRLFSGFGREDDRNKFHGGTIFQDTATGIIWVKCQVSLVLARRSCPRFVLRNGYGKLLLLRSNICTVIMESSLRICSVMIARSNISLKASLV